MFIQVVKLGVLLYTGVKPGVAIKMAACELIRDMTEKHRGSFVTDWPQSFRALYFLCTNNFLLSIYPEKERDMIHEEDF
jgi:hypothetical protein